MLEKLKMLLGIEDDSRDQLLDFLLEDAQDMVKNYCNICRIPHGLHNVIVRMAADLYRSEGYGQESKPQAAQSVSRGDVTINYASAATVATASETVLNDYRAQLNAFRRLRW